MRKPYLLLTEQEAARILGLSIHTLRSRRFKCQPPIYHKMGKAVRYRMADLQEYLESCRVNVQGVR